MPLSSETLANAIGQIQGPFKAAKEELHKVIIGQEYLVDRLLVALLSAGHVLLEGVPGLAKTLAATTLAEVVQCDCKRIQFTPDLLPADLLGTSIYKPHEGIFSIHQGPVFTHILLADEINRAPAKVQSALLEVMQERQVTISGQTFKMEEPYLVVATQNPIEHEGTYPLPEAQMDRFLMKLKIGYPTPEEEKTIAKRMGTMTKRPHASAVLSKTQILEARRLVDKLVVDDKIIQYIVNIVQATRNPSQYNVPIDSLIALGASPRATLALKMAAQAHAFLSGRPYVTPHDVKQLAPDILRHRLKPSYEAESEGQTSDDIIARLLATVPIP